MQKLGAQQISRGITQGIFGGGGAAAGGGGGGGGWGSLLSLAFSAIGSMGGGGAGAAASVIAAGSTNYLERQGGGPVFPGHGYLVGESGIEFFAPGRMGTIIPHSALGGSGGGGRQVVVNMTINTPDANSFRASQSQIAADTARSLRRADRRGN
jgi:hypothetical protein